MAINTKGATLEMGKMGSAFFAGVCLLLSSSPGWSQASVNETLESAVIYVDSAKGSDTNPGTSARPLKTLSAAASLAESNNQKNVGSRVIINPGTYREAVTFAATAKTTSAPVTFEAATSGTVFVSGAQTYTGWKASGFSGVYTHAWPYAWGLCAPLPGSPVAPQIVLRREMVFVNGSPLTQVLASGEMMPGTFYVDEKGGTISIRPAAGTNVATADIEVSTLPQVWTVQGHSNLAMRGLTFEYANSCRDTGAVEVSGAGHEASNVLFDGDRFVWNNAHGLRIAPAAANYTVQNSLASHNGESGFQASKVKYGLFQSDEASYNNWRGAQGAYYNWNSGGAHFYQMHDLTADGLDLNYNQSYAVHFDTDNENVTLSSVEAYGNQLVSIFVEKSQGPVSMANSAFCGGSQALSASNVGLVLRNSESVSVTGTSFVNYYNGVQVTGVAGGTPVSNWETGQAYQLVAKNLTLMQDVVEAGAGQRLFSDSLGGADWTTFQGTLLSNYNTWWDGSNSKPFMVPTSKTGTAESFSGWQTVTGQDKQSVFQAPSSSFACSAVPDRTDYWFVVPYTVSPATVGRGSAAAFTATLVPLGFNGTAQLSADGVQNIPGARGSWSASSIGPNGSATFTVTTGASTPAGTYPVVLMASSGGGVRTVTVLVTVQ